MARGYKGTLNLNRVIGIRPDKGQYPISIKSILKKDEDLPKPTFSKKPGAKK